MSRSRSSRCDGPHGRKISAAQSGHTQTQLAHASSDVDGGPVTDLDERERHFSTRAFLDFVPPIQ